MNRYRTVIIPAYDDFIDTVSFKVDSESDINTIGLSAYDDITALVRELVDKAYNAGYDDCKDNCQQGARLLKTIKAGYAAYIENLKAGGNK